MIRQIKSSLVFVGLIFCLPSPVLARTWNIFVDGSGDAPTIQAGIDDAAKGDTIIVHPGTYEENINFLGKNILIRSATGPAETVIDGKLHEASCVSFVNHEGSDACLDGFTIVNGTGSSNGIFGGGIIILGASPTVRRNVISENATMSPISGGGGGIWCEGTPIDSMWSSPRIEGNTISGNSTRTLGGGIGVIGNVVPLILDNIIKDNQVIEGDGGGIALLSRVSGALVSGNKILGNQSGDHGGGVYFGSSVVQPLDVEISSNLIAGNTAKGQGGTGNSGGGIWVWGANAWVHHNTIVNNAGDGPNNAYGGGIVIEYPGSPSIEQNIIAFSTKGGGIWCGEGATPTIRNNLAWQNVGGEGVGTCATWWQSNGNVVDDPHFCDMVAGDFHVASNSGVMTHPAGPLGAYSTPGCGPVSVLPSTWGSLKAKYSSSH